MRRAPAALLTLASLIATTPAADAATLKVPADFATIQGAIDAASSGDVIVISAGTYLENLSVASLNDLTIKAKKGHKVIVDGDGGNQPLLSIGLCGDTLIRDIRFRNTNNAGVSILLCSGVTIEDCQITDTTGDGIILASCSTCTIRGCKITDAGDDGVDIQASSITVENNSIKNPSRDGIAIRGSRNTVRGNTVFSAGDSGISLGTEDKVTSRCLVRDNEISFPGISAIFADDDANSCYILKNRALDATKGNCISVAAASDGHAIQDNTCERASGAGIYVGGSDVTMEGNTIKLCVTGILLAATADNALVVDNKVKKSVGDGIVIATGTNLFVRNKAKGSGAFDLDDNSGGSANVFVDNSFGTIDL